MSDFLAHLAARSSGSGEIIRPRVASLFEPLPSPVGPIGLGGGFPTASEPFVTERPVFEESEARVSAERSASPVAGLSNARTEGRPDERLPQGRLPTRDFASLPRPGVQLVAEEALSQLPGSEAPWPRSAGNVVRVSAALPAESPGDRAPSSLQTPKLGSDRKPPAGDSREARSQGPEHKPPLDGNRDPDSRPSELSLLSRPNPADAILQPHLKAAPQTDHPWPKRARPAVEPEPTIQVTIGRIEVRATSTPAPASAKERQVPRVMSLDEYLQRRSGRGGGRGGAGGGE
ncbi:MAG: hypothetical protein ACRD3T_00065 [Terriglobia bacterium]